MVGLGGLTLFFSSLRSQNDNGSLAQAFEQTEDSKKLEKIEAIDEVEPIVVGRERWNEKPTTNRSLATDKETLSNVSEIQELDALETQQANLGKDQLPVFPPKIMPAVDLNRNFEGTLVLRPRKLGFESAYPYHLESASGKRLAFVDMINVHAVNPLRYNEKRVNVLGKLEAVEEGSKEFVIRAKIIRLIE